VKPVEAAAQWVLAADAPVAKVDTSPVTSA